tara:strand:- start:438 stop:1520 length:1083 start_codon:yes stop_codon:yes gene_type:complete
MNKKIAIIGGGLFGITTYIILKKNGYDCTLFEKKSDLLLGASTNNLNRVHFGYHYPRDDKTVKQSFKGYVNFKKLFKEAIIRDFKNYYLIAEKSKVNLRSYLKFCKRNKLEFDEIIKDRIGFTLNKIEGGIKVKEPIYDWRLIKKKTKSILKKLKKNKINLNEEVIDIKKSAKFRLASNKKNYDFDIIIDASYEQSNTLIKNFKNLSEKKYQLVVVFEFIPKNFKKIGLALMDGNFFSFLPKGKENKHLLYHVKHSIIRESVRKEYPKKWNKISNYKSVIQKSKKLILKDFRNYFPDLQISITKNMYINPRVLLKNVEKNDRRISKINEITKNYFQIFSAKVDHSVDISFEILKKIKKSN